MRDDLATLGRGHSGISVLFSSRSAAQQSDAIHAHQHLQRCAQLVSALPQPVVGLHGHLTGLGFAMAAASAGTNGGYTKALHALDTHVTGVAEKLCSAVDRQPHGELDRIDVISGLTGIGRYLLLRGGNAVNTLRLILDTLASTALRDSSHAPHASADSLPGFWTAGPPSPAFAEDTDLAQHGHLNLGLAHGIPGPLALLSLAHEQGYADSNHTDAIARLAELLITWVQYDEHGPFWPGFLSRHEYLTGTLRPRGRLVRWCYGSPGVSRALQLAGRSTGRSDWLKVANESIAAVLATPRQEWGITDMGLCHGWAGVLHLLGYFRDGENAAEVEHAMADIATIVVDGFDPTAEFGYRVAFDDGSRGGDYPGLLEGAAGIALALDSYTRGASRTFPWDAAFLTA
ncbi:lanthionine synthetase C family protein [Streptomyces mirabilis]|uniref:lanthionine synthetase C family protein n=1 Tax=Streptomyces mirabilis TaxID=68239 RepID=UPI003819F901